MAGPRIDRRELDSTCFRKVSTIRHTLVLRQMESDGARGEKLWVMSGERE